MHTTHVFPPKPTVKLQSVVRDSESRETSSFIYIFVRKTRSTDHRRDHPTNEELNLPPSHKWTHLQPSAHRRDPVWARSYTVTSTSNEQRAAGCGMDRPEQRAPRDGPATAAPCSGVTNLGASACCRRGRARPSSPTRPHERARDERGERRKGRDEQAAAAAGVRAHVSVYALRNDPETCGAERHG